ncbi:MAG: SIS domain-containing protein [Nanoarchaeota archaeon]
MGDSNGERRVVNGLANLRGLIVEIEKRGEFKQEINSIIQLLQETFSDGNKVLIAGNGGSASQAMHFSDEMMGRYKENRKPYPVIALNADSAVLTCIANDFGYDEVFSRQVEGLGKKGDVFIGLSTSGNSKNILLAADIAKKQGLKVVALTGAKGKLLEKADIAVKIPIEVTSRMQEMHLHAIHLICEAFEPRP